MHFYSIAYFDFMKCQTLGFHEFGQRA